MANNSDPANNSSDLEDEPDLSTSLDCEMYTPIQWGLLSYSILVFFFYSFFQKRVRLEQNFLYGYFGLIIPINFIHETRDRWAYAAVFGILSGTFVQLIFDSGFVQSSGYFDSILRGFNLFLIMLLIPMLFFALIGSIHANIQVVSHGIGFIYTLTALIQQLLVGIMCLEAAEDVTPTFYRNSQYIRIFGTIIPILCCTIAAALYFVVRGVQALISIITNKPFAYQQDVNHHLGYVKEMLRKKSDDDDDERPKANTILEKILACTDRIYKRDPYFRYPVRVMCAASVIIIGLLVLTFQLINFFATGVRFAEESIDDDSLGVTVIIATANIFAVIIPVIAYVTLFISFVASLATYRKHCKRVWKGDHSFMPRNITTPAETLVRSTYYIGWQIGMAMWAWVFYIAIMLSVIVVIIVIVLLMVFVEVVREWLIERTIIIVSTFVFGLICRVLQILIARCVFVNGESSIANNSRLFHMYTYFFLFYNALVGLGRALRRVFTSAVVNLFFLPRLDRSLLIKGLDSFDKGYVAYLSAVKIDTAYNNPVMNVFVYLLSATREAKKKPSSACGRFMVQNYYQLTQQMNSIQQMDSMQQMFGIQQIQMDRMTPSRARNMWHLAYTLIRNPSLKELRKRDKRQEQDMSFGELTQEILFSVASNAISVGEEKNKFKMEFKCFQ